MRFASSRTFPGHAYRRSASRVSLGITSTCRFIGRARRCTKKTDQRGDVVGSLAQRRDVDREDVQAVVEVVAEALLLDQPGQVAVRRGDQADVDLDRPGAADTLELLLLEDPEELRLELEGDLADLVEEERAAMGHLEASDLLRDGPGEGAALVAEELALEKPRRDGRAID